METAPALLEDGPADATVVAEVTRGNREMFEVIVRRYNRRLYRVGMAYMRDHALAEEAMQNCYIKAYRALPRFTRRSSFSTWLTRIMINECLMLLRQRRRDPQVLVEDMDEAGGAEASGRSELTLQDMKALLESALQELPRKQRAVYLFREIERLSTEETAVALQLTPSDVKVSLMRAREALKQRLLRRAETAELFPFPAVYCNGMTERVMGRILTGR